MAGVSPIMIATMGAGIASGAQAANQASAQTSAQAGAANSGATEDYQLRIDQLNAQAADEKRRRQAAYASNSAKQRAQFAARGLSPSEGSSAAVLDGLKTMSDAEAKQRARQADLARQRVELSMPSLTGTDLLAKKSSLYEDNLSKLLTWE